MAALALVLLADGACSMFATAPKDVPRGKDVVVILYDSTDFRDAVVENVTGELEALNFRVVIDKTRRAKFYKAADYAAVIHISEYWVWHVPLHAKRYYYNNNRAENIVFVVTSGDPDVKITKPFDAVTGASRKENVARFSREIMEKLKAVLQ